MCGIFGIVSTKTKLGFTLSESRMMADLVYMDTLRGDDATGCSLFNNKNEFHTIKDIIPGYEMIKHADFKTMNYDMINNGLAFIGHNRKRTLGENITKNAHPFIIDNRYIFFHNGTLTLWKNLLTDIKTEEVIDVDSEALAYKITRCDGDVNQIAEVLGSIYGAWAMVWYDTLKLKMYILRNVQRPLWYGQTKFGYVFASEANMMVSAAARNGIDITDIKEFVEGTLYSLPLNKLTAEFTEEVLPPKKYVPPHMGATNHGPMVTDIKTIVSKNRYKYLRKKYMGQAMSFWLEDYAEAIPETDLSSCTKWLVFGTNDNLPIKNLVKGIIDNVTLDELCYMWDGAMLQGVVTEIEYNKENSEIHIILDKIVKISGVLYPKISSITHRSMQ